MSATTARGQFPYPTATDNWKQIRAAIQDLAEQVADVAALYVESTAGTRNVTYPVGVAGRWHRATDTGALSLDTGTAWVDVPSTAAVAGFLTAAVAAAAYVKKTDPVTDLVSTLETTTSPSYTDLATVGPVVTVTTGTRALVIVSCNEANSLVNGVSGMSFAVSGATTRAASDDDAFTTTSSPAGAQYQGSFVSDVTGLTPGSNTFTAKYYAGGGGASSFRRRRLIVIPL